MSLEISKVFGSFINLFSKLLNFIPGPGSPSGMAVASRSSIGRVCRPRKPLGDTARVGSNPTPGATFKAQK